MKTLRFSILYSLTLLKRYWVEAGIVIGLIILAIFGLIRFHNSFFRKTVTEGLVGTYTVDQLPVTVTSLLSGSLVKLDSAGLPKPDLVESWQSSGDAKEYIFKLKPNLYWSDGTSIKSSNISLALEGADIETPDDQTIDIKLSDSYSFLPELLTKPIFKKDSQTGVGPYHISGIDYSPNSVFIQKLTLDSGREEYPRLIIRFYSDEKTALDAIRMGEVESVLGLGNDGGLSSLVPFVTTSKANYSSLVTIFYNTKDPVLSDRNFRLALSFAAPQIKNETTALTSFPQASWAFNPDVRDYLDNPDQAKSYFDKVKDGKTTTITLTCTSSLQNIGQQVVDAWNNQGIKAVLKVESGIPQNFQALLITQDIPLSPDQYSLWHSTQSDTNFSKISSPRIDKDLEDGRKLPSIDDRKAQYADFQKVLLDESPATFLYFPKFNVTYMKKVEADIKRVTDIQLAPLFY